MVEIASLAEIDQLGIDYLLATTKDQGKIDSWYNIWQTYYKGLGEKTAMLNLRVGKWRGYETKELPGFTIGMRPKDCMIKLSGGVSDLVFPVIYPYVHKVARIDLQCTYKFASPYENLAQMYYEMLEENKYKKTSKSIVLSELGQTLYLGSFSSDTFARIYDRAKALKIGPGLVWRYEVIYRNTRASTIFRHLRHCVEGTERAETIHRIVAKWFKSHWCDLPEAKPPQAIDLIQTGAKIKTASTQLEWLRSSIKPAIAKMLVAGIDETEIKDSLGLT